ncbi:LytTr DNA-binding domain-containing protein [Bifidobacterium italicum]|uniref:LytTr DNA-binding domain-containing protein n=1 Tax=Bifidobacterium italicum TaxID=1960968 RepID=A0A2A2EGH1_9BIFI|nr:LytTR family DNA-binding domain-containing protein [Bifidobacterium italicum]PAU68153.1 LytTr DNA-binding domain-containing protein [Bifidobacterium italicum]
MRVELSMNPAAAHEEAHVTARASSDALDRAVRLLASIGDDATIVEHGGALHDAVVGRRGGGIVVVPVADVAVARADNGAVRLVTAKGVLKTNSRLYELERQLGADFVRISKSAIVNLNKIDRIEPGFGGAYGVRMVDGTFEWISRRYLGAFKAALGM